MIDSFTGKFRFLSNFHERPVRMDGVTYTTAEHAYQTEKTEFPDEKILVMKCLTPGQAKRQGRENTMRRDWESIKLEVMEEVVRAKFCDSTMQTLLKNTGDSELIEGNNWGDTFWGVCKGEGRNELGKILMKIRGEL